MTFRSPAASKNTFDESYRETSFHEVRSERRRRIVFVGFDEYRSIRVMEDDIRSETDLGKSDIEYD